MLAMCCQNFYSMCTLCVLEALFWKNHTNSQEAKRDSHTKWKSQNPHK